MNLFTIQTLDGDPIATFGPTASELPQMIEGRLDQVEPIRLMFRSSRARLIVKTLRAYLVPSADLFNGEPSRAFDGTAHAQTLSTGRIVRLAYRDDGDDLTNVGILVSIRNSVGPDGPLRQEAEFVFYPMPPGSVLLGVAGQVIDRVPTADDEVGS